MGAEGEEDACEEAFGFTSVLRSRYGEDYSQSIQSGCELQNEIRGFRCVAYWGPVRWGWYEVTNDRVDLHYIQQTAWDKANTEANVSYFFTMALVTLLSLSLEFCIYWKAKKQEKKQEKADSNRAAMEMALADGPALPTAIDISGTYLRTDASEFKGVVILFEQRDGVAQLLNDGTLWKVVGNTMSSMMEWATADPIWGAISGTPGSYNIKMSNGAFYVQQAEEGMNAAATNVS